MVDRRYRESEGKVKIDGYMSVSDEEAHQRWFATPLQVGPDSLPLQGRSSSYAGG